ncbi:hypothetical protein GV794_09350 [Nocardia cyriacigeorgica]|uniref:Uncharacterized protein n=1 Tax=Nocardia cyriacigeorgica TaxID=135487 RepID=A0A6P1D9G5_9NOCA|nr:hypothetical protein [Nocardia cyriacigeorgica]NEW42793.1 hypothetical protein [Nocardia cyriacigeorgica]NEW46748.1 hypothetical protein [Nocardia cyriacigeorgica]NEW52065.1 hypothetical protein [Nocardia cyriacigeorgica]NEW55858.1 hypothetical protein [Nocardia cyriacigeorgica]
MSRTAFRVAAATVASGALASAALMAGMGTAQAGVIGYSVVPEAWGYTVTVTTGVPPNPAACQIRVGPLSAPVPVNVPTRYPALPMIPINVELYCDGTYVADNVVTPRFV